MSRYPLKFIAIIGLLMPCAAWAEGPPDYEGLLVDSRDEFRLSKNETLRYKIAVCLDNLGKLAEARNEYQLFLKNAPSPSEREVTIVQNCLTRIDPQVALLKLAVSPEGSTVNIDGQPVEGVAPFSIPWAIEPGDHLVEVSFEGYENHRQQVSIEPGETGEVQVALEPSRPPPSPRRISPAWFASTLGLAAALAVGGIVTGVYALRAVDDFALELNPCRGGDLQACDDGDTIADRGEALGRASTGLFVSSGVLAATAFALAFFTEWHRSESGDDAAVSLNPIVSTSSFGLLLEVSIR